MDPHKYEVIFNKGEKAIQWKKIVFSTTVARNIDIYMHRERESRHRAALFIKSDSKWSIAPNVQVPNYTNA